MFQPTALQILIAAVIMLSAAMLLIRRGFKGRLVSTEPHCRNCKHNLSTLELDDPTPCPTCGIILRTSTPAIEQGRRKARKPIIATGLLLLILAISCASWIKVRTLPAVQSFDIYTKLPESMLISLQSRGNKDALQELHSRLIPGTLSDDALQSLIDTAFQIQADPNQVWDTRYGDVLYYALVQDKLTQDQVSTYIESSFKAHLVARDNVNPSDETVYFEYGRYSTGAFENDPGFKLKLERANSIVWPNLRLKTFQFAVSRNEQPVDITENRGVGGESGVTFRKGPGSTWRLEEPFPLDQSQLTINLATEFVLRSDDHEFHRWIEHRSHTFTRAGNPIQYAKPVTDPSTLREAVNSLKLSEFSVPIKLSEAEKHQKTRHFGYSMFMISSEPASSAALIGRIGFRVGEFEIHLPQKTTLKFIPKAPASGSTLYGVHSNSQNLEFYKQNWLFWKQAVMQGTVDVIVYPIIEEYAKNPSIKEYIESPIIFRDVPITRYQPVYSWIQDQDGNRWQEWRWTRVGGWEQPNPVHGELLEEE
ncbi:MAG: hypothetical protein JJ974_04045 [Phycisphaerales bacterium]|nr:hypothetical protein [Phycisphaerales bacterium]